jgi:hypothetical protein
MFSRSRRRPEPFTPYDYDWEERRPWKRRWLYLGAVVAAGLFMMELMGDGEPRRRTIPVTPTPPIAEAAAPAPPPLDISAAPVIQPALSVPSQPPQTSPPPQAQPPRQPVADLAAAVPVDPPAPPAREVVTSARSGANLRSGPSLSSAVLWTAPTGTRMRVGDELGVWLQVETTDGERAGWMHRSVVSE